MDQNEKKKYLMKKLDWVTTIVPFVCVLILCLLFMVFRRNRLIRFRRSVSSSAMNSAATTY